MPWRTAEEPLVLLEIKTALPFHYGVQLSQCRLLGITLQRRPKKPTDKSPHKLSKAQMHTHDCIRTSPMLITSYIKFFFFLSFFLCQSCTLLDRLLTLKKLNMNPHTTNHHREKTFPLLLKCRVHVRYFLTVVFIDHYNFILREVLHVSPMS